MVVLLGFDLSQMRWAAFKHKNMFNGKWYFRSQRFVVYQIAMLVSLVAECIATYSLAKYEFHASRIHQLSGYTAHVDNKNIRGVAIATIVSCVMVATLFGAEFFFLLFWPGRTYPRWWRLFLWGAAVVISLAMGGSAFASTIVVATGTVNITGASPAQIQQYTSVYSRPSVVYRHFGQNIAWIVFLWPAFIATVASTVILIHVDVYGPKVGTPKEKSEVGLVAHPPSDTPSKA